MGGLYLRAHLILQLPDSSPTIVNFTLCTKSKDSVVVPSSVDLMLFFMNIIHEIMFLFVCF